MKALFALAALAVLGTTIGTASAQELRLRAGSFLPPTVNFGEPCKRFIDELNTRGAGKVNITLLPPGSVPPFELGTAVRNGVVDVACVPPAFYKNLMVEGEATIFSNLSFLEHRRTGAWEMLNRLHNEKANVQYLAAYGDGVKFHFYFRDTSVTKPEDFRGKKLRSSPNYQAFLLSLGATTLVLPPGEVFTALERGTVDGYGWPLWGIHDQSWDKHTKSRIDPGFYNVAVNVLVHLPRWRSMTDEQRKILNDTAIWLETEFPKWRDARSPVEEKRQADSGVKIIDLGPDWAKRASAAYWAELEKESPANMALLRRMLVRE